MLFKIEDIGNSFNEEQKEAIQAINGYVFNSAPPGSGKTFVLENRILWMATEHQIPTKNILAITFTNEAANEMKERIGDRLKEFNIENEVTASTFHSFAFKMLRKYASGNINGKFILLDEEDKNKILSSIIKHNNLDEGNRGLNRSLVREYGTMISKFKSKGLTIEKAINKLKERKEQIENYKKDNSLLAIDGLNLLDLKEMVIIQNEQIKEVTIYQTYENFKKNYKNGDGKNVELYDFDDLILNLKELLLIDNIRKKISKDYYYILCDEAQDIDPVQRDILILLSKENGNLFCIFDDDQSIYSFRNADPNLILDLPDLVPNSKNIILKENFRSTENIINAANYLIKNNIYRIPKWMTTNNQLGHKVNYTALNSKEAEAEFVCGKIEELRKEYNLNYKDFAILYRNNDLNRIAEQRLIKHSIPYKINRNITFFNRKEIKDIVSYLEVVINKSEFHLERIYKVPSRGFSEKTFNEFKSQVSTIGVTLFDLIKASDKPKIQEFNSLLEELYSEKNKPFSELINLILEKTNYINKEFTDTEKETRLRSIDYLKYILNNLEENSTSKEDVLIQLKILFGTDDEGIDREDKVSLMTIHSSKGKGFKVVFVIGCEEGVIPSYNAVSDLDIEEERRLMYVAITRAKLFCFLTRSQYRLDYNGDLRKTEISHFINEIPEEYIDFDETRIC